jgi:ANTAR domain-containing protein
MSDVGPSDERTPAELQTRIDELEDGARADQKHIGELEDSAGADQKHIGELTDQGILDRSRIRGLEDQGILDRHRIDLLEAAAGADQELIAHLEAEGIIDRDKITNLETALITARRIGAAMGVLMFSRHVPDEQAFDLLREASQRAHRKLRDIAEDVVFT